MPDPDQGAAEVFSAVQRFGVATAVQIHEELEGLTLGEIEKCLASLDAMGKIDRIAGVGNFYRIRREPVEWDRIRGKVVLVHNDPVDILQDAHGAYNLHPGVEHAGLESVFSALIQDANHSLQIVSPYIDIRSVERFALEFRLAFSRGIHFTYVGRGILRREPPTGDFQYVEKISALQRLWEYYCQNNPEGGTGFILRDYLRFEPVELDRPEGYGWLRAAVHHKIIVQDRRRAYLGSGELRNNSFGATGEAGVLVDGEHAELLADLTQCYARKGTPVDPRSLENLIAVPEE